MKTFLTSILLAVVLTLGLANVSHAGNGPYDGFWILDTNEIIVIEEYDGSMVAGLLSGFENTSWWAWFGHEGGGVYNGIYILGRNAGTSINIQFHTTHTAVFQMNRSDGFTMRSNMDKAIF